MQRLDISWGTVIDAAASPPQMRFAGSTTDEPVALGAKGWTPTNGDKVLLVTVGTQTIALPFVAL